MVAIQAGKTGQNRQGSTPVPPRAPTEAMHMVQPARRTAAQELTPVAPVQNLPPQQGPENSTKGHVTPDGCAMHRSVTFVRKYRSTRPLYVDFSTHVIPVMFLRVR